MDQYVAFDVELGRISAKTLSQIDTSKNRTDVGQILVWPGLAWLGLAWCDFRSQTK